VDIWCGIGRGMSGFFSDMVRDVLDPCEGSKILSFLFGPDSGVQTAPTSTRSWKANSANFAMTEISEGRLDDRVFPGTRPPTSTRVPYLRTAQYNGLWT
jgi:hypothetical protein